MARLLFRSFLIAELWVLVVWHDADHVSRPIGDPCLADDPVNIDRAEPAGVGAVVAIVAKHEDRSFWNDDVWARLLPSAVRLFPTEVLLVEPFSIDVDAVIVDLDRFSGEPDHPLDVRLVLAFHGWIEHDDVAALGWIEWIDDVLVVMVNQREPVDHRIRVKVEVGIAIDKQHLVVLQAGHHAEPVDPEIEHDGADGNENDQGEDQRFDDLAEHRGSTLFLCLVLLAGQVGRIVWRIVERGAGIHYMVIRGPDGPFIESHSWGPLIRVVLACHLYVFDSTANRALRRVDCDTGVVGEPPGP